MEIDEQERRKFSPIQGTFSENADGYRTYATNLIFFDPMKLRSDYVITYEIEERDARAALGGSIRKFDRICARLFLSGVQDSGKYSSETYLYQVNKIYTIDESGNEVEVVADLASGHIYLPNRPDRNQWMLPETPEFLNELFKFKDPIFNKALKYLYSSSVGHFRLENYEKIALDHFKSIELIVNTLVDKDKVKEFKKRAAKAAEILELTPEQIEEINKYWDARSNGDIAHSDGNDMSAFYPNQMPLPSNMNYPWSYLDRTARTVLLKYFSLRKRYFHVDIERTDEESEHLQLGTVNQQSECNRLFFHTRTRDKKVILSELKKRFGEEFNVDLANIEAEYAGSLKLATVLVKDTKATLDLSKIRYRMIKIGF
jgi:hypothetical protein